ncbi:MAG: PAS domain-containing protein [Polyangiales bacterium]
MADDPVGAEALRDAFHVASLDPPRWAEALRDLARFVAGPNAGALGALTLIAESEPETGWLLAGVDHATERGYDLSAEWRHPLFRDAAKLPEGFVGATELFADPQDLARSTLAREHLLDDGTILGTSAVLLTSPLVAAVHVLGRRGAGTWDDGAPERLRAVCPALRRAVEVYARVRRQRMTARIDDAMLDKLDVATFALSPSGVLLRMNASARALVARADGLTERDGALECTAPRAQESLRAAVAAVLRGEVPEAVVIAPRPSGERRPLLLFVSSLRDERAGSPRAVTVLARDTSPQGRRVEELLRTVFSLTPTEARLAFAIAEGSTPAEASELLGMSVLTARTHLKRIFDKTSTTRQAELVRLVLAEFPPVNDA